MIKIFFIILTSTCLFSSSTYYEYGKKVKLTPYIQNKSPQLNKQLKNNKLRYYKNKNNRVVGVDSTIIAKCLKQSDCEAIMKQYQNLTYKTISKDTYLITVDTHEDIFKLSVKLYEEGSFLYAHPNFYRQRELR